MQPDPANTRVMGEFTARARAEAQISRDLSQSNMENSPIKTRVASQRRRW